MTVDKQYPEDRRHQIVLSEADLDKFVDNIVERVREKHNEFDLDPEQHYKDHHELSKFLKTFNDAQNIFVKAFLSLVFLGAFALVAWSFWFKH